MIAAQIMREGIFLRQPCIHPESKKNVYKVPMLRTVVVGGYVNSTNHIEKDLKCEERIERKPKRG